MVAQADTPAKEAAAKCPDSSRKGKQQREKEMKPQSRRRCQEPTRLLASFMGHEHQDLASRSTSARRAPEQSLAKLFPEACTERKQLLEDREEVREAPGAQLCRGQLSSCPDIVKR